MSPIIGRGRKKKQDDPRAQSKNTNSMEAYMCDTHTMQKEHMTTNMYVCKNVEGMKAARTCNVCNKCQ